jgi:Ohr subfamily peroxiredoxin
MAPVTISPLYTATATVQGGRNGRIRSSDGVLDMPLAMPKELGGAGGAVTNPEQLFAAGYAACFLGAMKAVSAKGPTKVPNDATVTSTVGIGPRSEGGFGLTIALTINLPGVDRTAAEELVRQAHQVCPYSNATRGNIDVGLTVA